MAGHLGHEGCQSGGAHGVRDCAQLRHRVEETCGLFGQIRIGRHCRELIFPKIEILPREGCEIRLFGHDDRL
ncbi:MAG: hypothetical protein HOK98_12160 [Rhodospirillaceae bacterium]|jgi:hypothetical protein|nr:hypothetical protein [Rhodospirillaceae bacterium]MBT6536927.1 hypothetical protein [Rhodospirillaceae bacterium]MBT7364184.1 hypothetical protein [Rhodospirillaceae bacterium]